MLENTKNCRSDLKLAGKEISRDDFNSIIKELRKNGRNIMADNGSSKRVGVTVFVWETPKNAYILGRFIHSTKLEKYRCSLDGREIKPVFEPKTACSVFSRAVKVQEMPSYKFASSSPFQLYKSGEYKDCWCYDINKAYLQVLMDVRMPDTSRMKKASVVGKDEIGFSYTGKMTFNGRKILSMQAEGRIADYVFPLGEAVYHDFAEKYIERLSTETDPIKRKNIKSVYTIGIGNLQNHNPFWRATIVETCNANIKKYIDKNTIYSNTDCIISTVERKDLTVGKAVGQFKIEHHGDVRIDGANIYWADGAMSRRGADITTNIYKIDIRTKELIDK